MKEHYDECFSGGCTPCSVIPRSGRSGEVLGHVSVDCVVHWDSRERGTAATILVQDLPIVVRMLDRHSQRACVCEPAYANKRRTKEIDNEKEERRGERGRRKEKSVDCASRWVKPCVVLSVLFLLCASRSLAHSVLRSLSSLCGFELLAQNNPQQAACDHRTRIASLVAWSMICLALLRASAPGLTPPSISYSLASIETHSPGDGDTRRDKTTSHYPFRG